jgi:hypothetical protein
VSEIERYLDELFDRLAGQVPRAGALAEAEDHLRAAAADAVAGGLPAARPNMMRSPDSAHPRWWPGRCARPTAPGASTGQCQRAGC